MNSLYIRSLYEYDTEMNRRLLESLKKLDFSLHPEYQKTRGVFNHILFAGKIWVVRLNGKSSINIPVWPDLNWEQSEKNLEDNAIEYDNFLSSITEAELTGNITYQNSRGTTFRQPVLDILMHVLMHGAYHRGKLRRTCAGLGIPPW